MLHAVLVTNIQEGVQTGSKSVESVNLVTLLMVDLSVLVKQSTG